MNDTYLRTGYLALLHSRRNRNSTWLWLSGMWETEADCRKKKKEKTRHRGTRGGKPGATSQGIGCRPLNQRPSLHRLLYSRLFMLTTSAKNQADEPWMPQGSLSNRDESALYPTWELRSDVMHCMICVAIHTSSGPCNVELSQARFIFPFFSRPHAALASCLRSCYRPDSASGLPILRSD